MLSQLATSFRMLLTLTVLTGVVYPLTVTGVARLAFPHQAAGSLIKVDGRAVGSELIGQQFSSPQFFWGRLSATGPVPYNAAASSGSNFGPLHPQLKAAAEQRIAALKAAGISEALVPVDLVTASGSGLDPHISPAAADYQVARIAKARGVSEEQVRKLVVAHTQGRAFGVLGEPRVDVLRLNLALDGLSKRE